MVSSDKEVHAQQASCVRRIKSADSGIDTDDEPNVSSGRALDDVIFHAVSFANTMRNVEVGSTATEFDGGLENHNRGSAIHVVVAVNQDSFLALDSGFQSIDRGLHAGHQVRRVQMCERRAEI